MAVLKVFGKTIFEYRGASQGDNVSAESYGNVLGFYGNTSKSGAKVNEASAMGLAPYFAAVRVISEALAVMPLKPYQIKNGNKEVAKHLPAYRLLNLKPNNFSTPIVFKDLMIETAINWGNSYAYIRKSWAQPAECEYIHPTRVNLYLDKKNRELFYHLLDYDLTVPATEILHIKAFGNGILGKSLIRVHMETLGNGLATKDLSADFYKNGGVINGYLSSESNLTKDQRELNAQAWKLAHGQGGGQRYGTAVLGGGMKYNRVGVPPEEGQFIEAQKFTAQEIAAITKVPAFMIQAGENKFKDLESLNIWFYTNTLLPWAVRFEQELDVKMFTISQRESGLFYWKFSTNAILRGSIQARTDHYKQMAAIGALSINEIRDLEDKNPIENGNEHYIAANNMAPVGLQKDYMNAKINALNSKIKTQKNGSKRYFKT